MPRATRMTFSKRMVMNSIKVARFCAAVAAFLISSPINGYSSQYSRNDPYPVYTADSPLAPFTYLEDGKPIQHVRGSISYFRQAANRVGLSNQVPVYQSAAMSGSGDVEIGDVYGPWNVLGLFYPEKNGNTQIQTALLEACTGCANICGCGTADCPDEPCITDDDMKIIRKYIQCDQMQDPNGLFGGMSVPVLYRKYGARFLFEAGAVYGFGLRAECGLARVQQYPAFNDLTSKATPTTTYPAADGLVISKYFMQQFDTAIAQTLDLNVDPYCSEGFDDSRFSLYYCHPFDANKGKDPSTHMPPLVFTPYIIFECSPFTHRARPYSTLFSVPLGNDGHTAVGFTTGFTVNFLDMFTMGLDGSVTHFSEETHHNCPVPTSDLQVGVFPRKADLRVQPGKNFTFGATMSAEYFWFNFSAWVEFRMINHCRDGICILNMVNVPNLPIPTDYPISNIKLDLLREQSSWSSSFGNVGLTYDITDALSLGFFWQAPIRQRFAYRPTTLMGSIIGVF